MAKIFNMYIKNEDHTWYDSSNIVYSVIFDDQTNNNKSLKIVFKGGRTYLYKNVDPIDYHMFREAQSQGSVFNEKIKHYECIKQDNTDLDKLEELKQHFISLQNPTEYNIHINLNDKTGEFNLSINNNMVFEGIEGNVSIVNLFKAMGLQYSLTVNTEDLHIQTVEDFENKTIV